MRWFGGEPSMGEVSTIERSIAAFPEPPVCVAVHSQQIARNARDYAN